MVKICLLIVFLFSGTNINYSGHIYGQGDFIGNMKLASLQWIRHCVTKNNTDLQKNFVLLVSARAGRPGEKTLRSAGEEGTTDPTSNLSPHLASLYAHQ